MTPRLWSLGVAFSFVPRCSLSNEGYHQGGGIGMGLSSNIQVEFVEVHAVSDLQPKADEHSLWVRACGKNNGALQLWGRSFAITQ